MSDETWEKMEDWEIKVTKRLSELEEDLKRDFEISNNSFILHFNEIEKNRKVLRELMKAIKDIHPNLWECLNQLLEKLDGKKDPDEIEVFDPNGKKIIHIKTLVDYEQCKKCGWNLSYGCSQQERRPTRGNNCPTYKTSGGEKLVEDTSNGEKGSPQQPDSKPPEPSPHLRGLIEQKYMCYCSACKEERVSLRDQEPRENDSERYIIKVGRFGAYFYDSKFKKDMDLEETEWILNQFELRKDLFYESQELISEFVKDLKILRKNIYIDGDDHLDFQLSYSFIIEQWEDKLK